MVRLVLLSFHNEAPAPPPTVMKLLLQLVPTPMTPFPVLNNWPPLVTTNPLKMFL